MSKVATLPLKNSAPDLAASYRQALKSIERLEARIHDLVRIELDQGASEINSVQAFLLYKIGDSEMSAAEIRRRGIYLGSNVTYNLKKLTELGYISRSGVRGDKRLVQIKLSDKGKSVANTVGDLVERLVRRSSLPIDELLQFVQTAERLEHDWLASIRG